MHRIGKHRYGRRLVAATLLAALCAVAATAQVAAAARMTTDCKPVLSFEDAQFSDSTTINNTFLPLLPGTELVLDGQANRGNGLVAHEVIFTITGVTKLIDGVKALAVWDRDISDGVLAEEELSLWAQDEDGNVWNLGEYPEELEGGVVTGAPSTWLQGVAEAQAGIHMFGDPTLGSGWYRQGWAPSIDFLDCARTHKTDETVCVPAGCYDGVLQTEETSPLDRGPGNKQRKTHAEGVGIVQIAAVGDREGETLTLTEFKHLSAADLAAANQRAKQLDTNAYTTAPDVWAGTEHAVLPT
jgi:hypothetical protein